MMGRKPRNYFQGRVVRQESVRSYHHTLPGLRKEVDVQRVLQTLLRNEEPW